MTLSFNQSPAILVASKRPFKIIFFYIWIWYNDHCDDDADGNMMMNPTKTWTKEDAPYRFKGKFLTGLVFILNLLDMMVILVVNVFYDFFSWKDSYTTLLMVAQPDWSLIDAIFSTNSNEISSISLHHFAF